MIGRILVIIYSESISQTQRGLHTEGQFVLMSGLIAFIEHFCYVFGYGHISYGLGQRHCSIAKVDGLNMLVLGGIYFSPVEFRLAIPLRSRISFLIMRLLSKYSEASL